ncbi:MAG: hypothetical protein BroJett003_14290 [Planctomycetota bacterium]|nr:MAG: hypothetical protein BroJett003_14290 [Planctomycetota bacterium]
MRTGDPRSRIERRICNSGHENGLTVSMNRDNPALRPVGPDPARHGCPRLRLQDQRVLTNPRYPENKPVSLSRGVIYPPQST